MPVVGNEVIDPLYYERYGYPHASWAFRLFANASRLGPSLRSASRASRHRILLGHPADMAAR
jgi:hypothetical protein